MRFLLTLLGDASYCTPEQYKDCAEPALGKSTRASPPSLHIIIFPQRGLGFTSRLLIQSLNAKPALKMSNTAETLKLQTAEVKRSSSISS